MASPLPLSSSFRSPERNENDERRTRRTPMPRLASTLPATIPVVLSLLAITQFAVPSLALAEDGPRDEGTMTRAVILYDSTPASLSVVDLGRACFVPPGRPAQKNGSTSSALLLP